MSQKVLLSIAEKVARLGWHTIDYLEAQDFDDLSRFLSKLPTTVVIDHMARANVRKGVNHVDFVRFLALLERTKITGQR
jgi:2-pyrone-4,6-dicarboxylate lactonase